MQNFHTLGNKVFRNQAAMLLFLLTLCFTGFFAASSQAATVSGRVWLDSNRNGLQDNGEPGLGNVFYFLIEVDAANNETEFFGGVTTGSGDYSINIPNTGNYRVRIANPTNPAQKYIFTLQDVNGNSNDNIDSDFDFFEGKTGVFAVTSTNQSFDFDAGFKADEPPVALCGPCSGSTPNVITYVWKDSNKNGIQDSGESPLSGVTVKLYKGNTLVSTLQTDANGEAAFCNLQLNVFYKLKYQHPNANYKITAKDKGTNDEVDSDVIPGTGFSNQFKLTAAACKTDVDAGFYNSKKNNDDDDDDNGDDDDDDDDNGDDDDDDNGKKSRDRNSDPTSADQSDSDVKLSPNPAHNLVRIELPATFTLATDLHLMNGMGQVVLHERVPAGEYRTELQLTGADMPSGVYYLRVQSGEVILTQKLVLVK